MELLPDYIERQEGPDGQRCDLLTRVPYDRQRMIEQGLAASESTNTNLDVCLRGLLWGDPVVKDALTGEMTDDIDRGAAEVIQAWRERAVVLYADWFSSAFPGPKGTSRTDGRTRPSGKKPRASATSGQR